MAQILLSELYNATYQFLPNIMHIIGCKDNDLNERIKEYICEISSVPHNAVIEKFHSMFSYVNCAGKGDIRCQDFLLYYDQQAKTLFDLCKGHANWLHRIKEKLKQSIFDKTKNDVVNPSNPAYLNYVAEILYATKILPASKTMGYEFCGFDMPLGNGKDADFLFKRVEDRKLMYFDNLSIHGVDIKKVESATDLYEFLKQRIENKISDKTKGLCKSGYDYVINGSQAEFYVAPILWTETSDFLPYKATFERFAAEMSLSKLFVALMPQRLSDGHYHFSIEMVNNILQQWEEQEKQLSDMKVCSKCGSQNPNEAKFCYNCGESFVTKIETQAKQNSISQPSSKSYGGCIVMIVVFVISVIICIVVLLHENNNNSSSSRASTYSQPQETQSTTGSLYRTDNTDYAKKNISSVLSRVSSACSKGGNQSVLSSLYASKVDPYVKWGSSKYAVDIPSATRQLLDRYDYYMVYEPTDLSVKPYNGGYVATYKIIVEWNSQRTGHKKACIHKTTYFDSSYKITGFVDDELWRNSLP